MCKCLFCYSTLEKGEKDFHAKCAKKFFGTEKVPTLDYSCGELEELAIQVIKDQTSLTGVQRPDFPHRCTAEIVLAS